MTDTTRAEKWTQDNITANSREEAELMLRQRGINTSMPLWDTVLRNLYPEEEITTEELGEFLGKDESDNEAVKEILQDKKEEQERVEANPIRRVGNFIRRLFRGQD